MSFAERCFSDAPGDGSSHQLCEDLKARIRELESELAALRLSAKRARLDAERWRATRSPMSVAASMTCCHTREADALEAGAEALELLAFLAANFESIGRIDSNDEAVDGKWSYRYEGKYYSRDTGGVPLTFMDALRLAKGTK